MLSPSVLVFCQYYEFFIEFRFIQFVTSLRKTSRTIFALYCAVYRLYPMVCAPSLHFLYHTMFTLFFSTVVWIEGTIIPQLRHSNVCRVWQAPAIFPYPDVVKFGIRLCSRLIFELLVLIGVAASTERALIATSFALLGKNQNMFIILVPLSRPQAKNFS